MSLPSGYKRLEYIQSDGNQWIDSGVVPGSSDFSVKSKICTTAATSAENWFVTIGHSKTSGPATFAQFGTWSSKFVIHLTGIVVDGSTAAISDDVTIDFSMSGNTASLSGDASYSVTNANFGSGSFRNQSITICDGLWRTYWSQIKISGSIVRDYIPCKKPDGTVGLWDDVNSVFYGNAGAGAFTAGPVMEPPHAPETLQHLLAVRLSWYLVELAIKYNIYRDGTFLGSTTETSFVDTTAEENQEYTYAVSAVGTGGESAKTTLTVYTKSGYFLYKPYIESATFQ